MWRKMLDIVCVCVCVMIDRSEAWEAGLKRSPRCVPLTVVFALSPAQLRIAPFSYKFWSGPRGGPLDIDVVDLRPGQFAVFRQDEVHSGGPASEDEAVRLHM